MHSDTARSTAIPKQKPALAIENSTGLNNEERKSSLSSEVPVLTAIKYLKFNGIEFNSVDHRGKGGAFWIAVKKPDSSIKSKLEGLGFKYTENKGFWIGRSVAGDVHIDFDDHQGGGAKNTEQYEFGARQSSPDSLTIEVLSQESENSHNAVVLSVAAASE